MPGAGCPGPADLRQSIARIAAEPDIGRLGALRISMRPSRRALRRLPQTLPAHVLAFLRLLGGVQHQRCCYLPRPPASGGSARTLGLWPAVTPPLDSVAGAEGGARHRGQYLLLVVDRAAFVCG